MSSELESRHAREDVKSPERPSADPTPAAPDPQPRVCSNCGAMLGPKETGHFVPPSFGESGFYYCRGAAPDQAEGPPNSQPTPNNSQIRSWDPTDREIL